MSGDARSLLAGNDRAERTARLAATLDLARSPTRLEVLLLLPGSCRYVSEFVGLHARCCQLTISRQLTLLRLGGLVESRREGQRVRYRLTDAGRQVLRV